MAKNRHLAMTKILVFLWVKKAFHLVRTKIHCADGSRTCNRPGPKLKVLMGQIYDKYIYMLWVLPLNCTLFTEDINYSNRGDQTAGIRGESVLCICVSMYLVCGISILVVFPGDTTLRIPSPPPPNTDKQ